VSTAQRAAGPHGATRATAADFLVRRDDLEECRLERATPAELIELGDGELLLAVDRFGLTTNNITLAAFGEALSYWEFFPADEGWGRIPVWGFADVVRSNHDAITAGERVYGYLPMSSHLVVSPAEVSASMFFDGSPRRRELVARPGLSPIYAEYTRTTSVAGYGPGEEDQRALLTALFSSSFVIDNFFSENDIFGATTVIVASASSRTAYGTAMLLGRRGVRLVGLTSPGRVDFVNGLGCYDAVLTYDDLDRLPAGEPAVYLDMSGDLGVRRAVHEHLGDSLAYDCMVGATHRSSLLGDGEMPGPAPVMFFATEAIDGRMRGWGREEYGRRADDAWRYLTDQVDQRALLEVKHATGHEAVRDAYLSILGGHVGPHEGWVLSF
jgi:hypothetical protein